MTLYEQFKEPSARFRQAPFWFWNHALDKETLDWQIDQMHEKGLGGFVMHARHGLITPYMGDDWFDAIRFCCEKAKETGMMPWAYDERDWPSGPAGGAVIADPRNRLKFLKLEVETLNGPSQLVVPDDAPAVYGCGADGQWRRLGPGEATVPEGPYKLGRAVVFDSPAILWYDSYLNTLDKRACSAFLVSTYDLHEEELGDLKQLGLEGFFTDEPAFNIYPDDFGRIPWSADLPGVFQEQKGYDLLECLPALFSPGEANRQVRYDYWDVATGLFESSFFETIEAWCEKRGLQLIGHALGEEPLFYQFRCVGNLFRHLRHFHMPGLDHLTIHIGENEPGGLAPKLVASAALLAGRNRVLTETFGESGWRLTLRDMKWMADWQIANGVNYIVPHAFYYSVAERRKKDSPPSEFVQNPFWPYYRLFADYTARLTAMLTPDSADEVTPPRVAVLYPMASVWADFVPAEDAGEPAVQAPFLRLCFGLQKVHRDFILIDEKTLAGAEVDEGGFRVNGLRFEVLVVPRLSAVPADTLAAVEKIAAAAVVVSAPNGKVAALNDGGNEEPREVDFNGLKGVRFIKEETPDELVAALAGVTPEVVLENAPGVLYLHRRKAGKEIYFFANTTAKPVSASASLETAGLAEIWDPEDGSAQVAPGQRVEDGRLAVPVRLAPYGSLVVVVDPEKQAEAPPLIEPAPAERVPVCSELWHFSPENGNFLALKEWTFSLQNKQHVSQLRYKTEFMTPELLANMRLILDGVPGRARGVPENARPIMKDETDAVVYLDGEPMLKELPWDIDPNFRVLDLRGCGTGAHQLEVAIKNNGWFPQPPLGEYAWLAGDFTIDMSMNMPCLMPVRGIKTGPWEKQGFPWFSGTGAYYADVQLPDVPKGKRVILNAGRVGDILDVEINGRHAGIRPWPPYRLDVTRFLCKGLNLFVLKVTNSAQNFFEGPEKNTQSGLLDEVWLEI